MVYVLWSAADAFCGVSLMLAYLDVWADRLVAPGCCVFSTAEAGLGCGEVSAVSVVGCLEVDAAVPEAP